MDMGWESFFETMDREDGSIGVLVWQGDSRRGADHDVPGDKRGLRMLEIRSETVDLQQKQAVSRMVVIKELRKGCRKAYASGTPPRRAPARNG